MATITLISGKLSLRSKDFDPGIVKSQIPSGLTIEFYGPVASDPPETPGTWLGFCTVPDSGDFKIIPAYGVEEGIWLLYKVFNGTQLIQSGKVQAALTEVTIIIDREEFDYQVTDESRVSTHPNYLIIKGKVTLGDQNILAIPKSDISVSVSKVLFREEVPVAAAYLDHFGNYEIKVPYRLLYPESPTPRPDLIPKVIVHVNNGSTVVATSPYTDIVSDTPVTVDLHIADDAHFGLFSLEYYGALLHIERVSGLDSSALHTITTQGTMSELQVLVYTSGLPESMIFNMVTAAVISEAPALNQQHVYALVRAGYLTLSSMSSLKEAEIEDILYAAGDAHIIAPPTGINTTFSKLEEAAVDSYGANETDDGDTLTDLLLAAAVNDPVKVSTFLRISRDYTEEGSLEAMWDKVGIELGAPDTEKFKTGLQLLALTGLQPEVTQNIIGLDELDALPMLIAQMSINDWIDLVTDTCRHEDKLCVPKNIKKEATDPDSPELIAEYAQKLFELSNRIYGTYVTRDKLSSDTAFAACFEDPLALSDYLKDNPAYNFQVENAWSAVKDDGDLRKDMLPLQNTMRLASGRADIAVKLIKGGIKSSSQVVEMPEADFLEAYFNQHDNTEIANGKKIYAKAVSTDLLSKQYYLQLLPGNYIAKLGKEVNFEIWRDEAPPAPSDPATPDLESLFGSMDFCACSDCTSMYSPAAYFTDLLNFIKTKLTATAYAELRRRRCDLIHIDLSCKNSNTILPYIDLVNELLELIILNKMHEVDAGTIPFVPHSFQTSGTTAELKAYPEHIYKFVNEVGESSYLNYELYPRVYDLKLKNAHYPNTLPFDLALEESRVFFSHLGYDRLRLMELYRPANYENETGEDTINIYDTAAERLGIPKHAADIIIQHYSVGQEMQIRPFYNYDSGSNTWYDDLCNDIDTLLDRTNITYRELLQLLVTDFLNKKTGDPAITTFAIVAKAGKPADTCAIEDLMLEYRPAGDPAQTIKEAKIALFDKMHRFIRLYKAAGITIYQLDILLTSFGATDINMQFLINMSEALQLGKTLGIAPDILTTLWSNISVHHYIDFNNNSQPDLPSPYDELFRNKAVINPPDPNFDDWSDIAGTLAENTASVIGALTIKEEDYVGFWAEDIDDDTTLEKLSSLYRNVLVYKSLGFRSYAAFSDMLSLIYTYPEPGTNNPYSQLATWQRIINRIHQADQSIFSTDELMYLIRHADPDHRFIPADGQAEAFYQALRADLKKVNADNADMPPLDLDKMLKNFVGQQFSIQFNIDRETADNLTRHVIKVTDGDSGPLMPLADYLIQSSFTSVDDMQPVSNMDQLYKAYIKAGKLTLVISTLLLTPKEVAMFGYFASYFFIPGFSFNDIPTMPNDPVASTFYRVLFPLNDWIMLRDRLNLSTQDFIRFALYSIGRTPEDLEAGSATKEDWLTLTAELIGWDQDSLIFLVGAGDVLAEAGALYTNFTDWEAPSPDPMLNSFKDAKLLLQVLDIMKAMDKLGMKVSAVYDALLPTITVPVSQTVRMAAKAKYSIENWLKIAKPLQDTLRVKQRDALADYIVANPDIISGNNMKWKNKNDLFAYLMIDIEMDACMETSRIRQGISTIQLYLDRIILHIERVNGSSTYISMNDETSAQWQTWRKWYRVWEANRKVFLYPENWIEPELRDDRTPLFKELQTFLLQDEATDSRLEEGFRLYLEGLDDVARLEPVSVYHEHNDYKDVLHVFGRTSANPQIYYYRKREDNCWSAWEKIPIDIKSQHAVPHVWNDKLYLFWLTFQTKNPGGNPPPVASGIPSSGEGSRWLDAVLPLYGSPTGNQNPEGIQVNITLNWSLRQDGKWLNHVLCKDVMSIDINKVRINLPAAEANNSSANMEDFFNTQAKRGEMEIDELFESRLYLMVSQRSEGGLLFSVAFPGGLNEDAMALHSFIWNGDSSQDPRVMRETDAGYCVIAPFATRFNKMKFVEDVRDGRLYEDVVGNPYTGYYTYKDNFYYPSVSPPNNPGIARRSIVKTDTRLTVLNQSPYKQYKITARSVKKLPSEVIVPIQERFFYEDTTNTYYVEKTSTGTNSYYASVRMSAAGFNYGPSIGGTIIYSAENYGIYEVFDSAVPMTQGSIYNGTPANSFNPDGYRFYTFYHAQIGALISSLNNKGIKGLLTLGNQSKPDTMNFQGNYVPTNMVSTPYPKNTMQLGFSDPYSIYNWELFFHIPMLIAQSLSNNQRFEEAQKWYHYVFDPTSNTGADGTTVINTIQRFWKFRRFYEEAGSPAQTLAELIMAINQNGNGEEADQVKVWEKNPFNPHIIARMRILAYMKNVMMKYLDNLIAWGDQLFRQDTIESVNEATQIYILAANILGDRPREIPPRAKRKDYTFKELLANGPLDALSNAMVQIESFFAPNDAPSGSGFYDTDTYDGRDKIPPGKIYLETLYFCLPKNDKLLAYWDTIADRLFKIRHCMNIQGQVRQLPLYEPPIDPALLVRATAMGLDIGTLINEISGQALPKYRFSYLVQKANEVINDVKALGNAILSAIEKKDAETLSLLRSTQEMQMLEKIKQVKELQVNEADAALNAVIKTKEVTRVRMDYYQSRPFKNASEEEHLSKLQSAMIFQTVQGVLQTVAGVLSAIPTAHAQATASGVSFGGIQLSNLMQAASTAIGIKVATDSTKATMAVTKGGYERRRDDWQFQAASAAKELEQLDRQILAAQIRLNIAQNELSNQELQIEHASAVDAYMRSKFSNIDLYAWMQGQIATSYFQSYQLAYDMARKAEMCFDYEQPNYQKPASGFIKYGYWDSLKKGLLSGESLQFDLRKMESSYMEANARTLELTKNISLAIFNPEALLTLKTTGHGIFEIPEILYDLDYPGHYMRRIKSVSISIPCVAGPYTTINCQLTQKDSRYRKDTSGSTYAENPDGDIRFVRINSGNRIATSTAQNDSGVFELNFRDERYLPFEGTGAISEWEIEFPSEYRQFDYNAISDVILHVKYTALYEGDPFKSSAISNLTTVFETLSENEKPLPRYFSLKHEFSNEWFAYIEALKNEEPDAALTIKLTRDMFPFFCKGRDIKIGQWYIQANPKVAGLTVEVNNENEEDMGITGIILENNNHYSNDTNLDSTGTALTEEGIEMELTIDVSDGVLNSPEDLEDLYFVAIYKLTE